MHSRVALIYCAVLEDEVRALLPGAPGLAVVEQLPQGLHNDPPLLRRELQSVVDRVETQHDPDVILIGYGLCSRGTEGVRARRAKIVIPRAHDCITLLLGNKERYAKYVAQHPGTYWYSTGWNRHHLAPGKARYETLKAQYVEKFGEEDAEYLMEQEQHWFSTYDRATFVDPGATETSQDREYTKACADWLGWNYDFQPGSLDLIRRMLAGDWREEEFLVLEPGQTLRMTADARVIEAVDAD